MLVPALEEFAATVHEKVPGQGELRLLGSTGVGVSVERSGSVSPILRKETV